MPIPREALVRWSSILLASLLAGVACDAVMPGAGAADGCRTDAECKGDRVCLEGVCTAPAAASPPASGSAPAVPVATPGTSAAPTEPVALASAQAPPAVVPPSAAVPPSVPSPSVAPSPTAAPSPSATPSPTAAPAPATAKKKSYAATVTGVCEKFVDCGCESTVESCKATLGGQTYAKDALKCTVKLDCASMCGGGPAECVKTVAAAEAAASQAAFEIGRSVRDHWPTGDGGSCPAGYRRSGDYCYPN